MSDNNNVVYTKQNMNNDETSSIISSRSNVFIVKLLNKDLFDKTKYDAAKDSLKNVILLRSKNQIYNQWLGSEKDRIEIKDLRSKIF